MKHSNIFYENLNYFFFPLNKFKKQNLRNKKISKIININNKTNL